MSTKQPIQARWPNMTTAQKVEEVATVLLGWHAGYPRPEDRGKPGSTLWWISEDGVSQHPVTRLLFGGRTEPDWDPIELDDTAYDEVSDLVQARLEDRTQPFRVAFEPALRQAVTDRLKSETLLPMSDVLWLKSGADWCLACLVAFEQVEQSAS